MLKKTTIVCLLAALVWGLWTPRHDNAAQAKSTRPPPTSRVQEGFKNLDGAFKYGPKHDQAARLPPSSGRYQFDHDHFFTAGRGSWHKECALDLWQDPGETSCRLVWAAI